MVWSARCILSVKLFWQSFETIRQVWRKLSKPTECPFFERSGEDLAPYRLIHGVEAHLCFVDVHVFVRICRTIIEFDVDSLPFGRELCLRDLISEMVTLWIIIIVNYLSTLDLLSGRLLSMCPNGCKFLLIVGMIIWTRLLSLLKYVKSSFQLLILFFEEAHFFFIFMSILDAFLAHVLCLPLDYLEHSDLFFSNLIVVYCIPCWNHHCLLNSILTPRWVPIVLV